jgi:hypothetical protein
MMEKPPLIRYVVGVLVVWAVILCGTWFMSDRAHFRVLATFCAGFLAGMLAMFIAVHLYNF